MRLKTNLFKKSVASLLASTALLANMPLCYAQSTEGTRLSPVLSGGVSNDVETVTNELFKKEIDLAKLTTTYRLHNTHETKVHKWLTATLSTVAYSVADAGNIVTFNNAFRFKNQPQNLHVGRAEAGPFLIFLGELFFFARTVSVSAVDVLHDRKINHQGFDRATFEKNATALETDIHALLARRQQLINGGDPGYAQEQVVLQDISDGLSREFVRNYARASRIRAFHCTENIDATYTASTGAWLGGLLIFLAAKNSNPRLTAPAGIGFIGSGAGFILKDFLSRRVSQHVEKKTTAELLSKRNLKPEPVAALESDNAKLISVGTGNIQRRKPAYDMMLSALRKDETLSKVENKEEKNKYIHDQTINALEGLACIGAGTILTQAGFEYRPSPNPLLKLDRAKNFLGKFGAAAITFTPTASGGIADTPIEAIYGEHKEHKDCNEGVCPKVGLADRMNLLNQAETTVR